MDAALIVSAGIAALAALLALVFLPGRATRLAARVADRAAQEVA